MELFENEKNRINTLAVEIAQQLSEKSRLEKKKLVDENEWADLDSQARMLQSRITQLQSYSSAEQSEQIAKLISESTSAIADLSVRKSWIEEEILTINLSIQLTDKKIKSVQDQLAAMAVSYEEKSGKEDDVKTKKLSAAPAFGKISAKRFAHTSASFSQADTIHKAKEHGNKAEAYRQLYSAAINAMKGIVPNDLSIKTDDEYRDCLVGDDARSVAGAENTGELVAENATAYRDLSEDIQVKNQSDGNEPPWTTGHSDDSGAAVFLYQRLKDEGKWDENANPLSQLALEKISVSRKEGWKDADSVLAQRKDVDVSVIQSYREACHLQWMEENGNMYLVPGIIADKRAVNDRDIEGGSKNNPSNKGVVNGRDISSTIGKMKKEPVPISKSTGFADHFGSEIILQLANIQGYNAAPRVVSADEFESFVRQSGVVGFRTLEDSPDGDPDKYVEEFQYEDNILYNPSDYRMHGDGIYLTTTMNAKLGEMPDDKDIYDARDVSSRYGKYIMKMTFAPNTSFVEERELLTQFYGDLSEDIQERWYNNSPNAYAVARGYDAIVCKGAGYCCDYTIVLNRTKLIVQEGYEVNQKVL